jgi:hypothetical protein
MAQPAEETDQQAYEIGQRQSAFREVNERIDDLAESFDLQEAMAIFCECGTDGCTGQITLSETEYESLRRIPTHFAVLPGHQISTVERVVEQNERYVVVEKFGESAIAAIQRDPRRRR